MLNEPIDRAFKVPEFGPEGRLTRALYDGLGTNFLMALR